MSDLRSISLTTQGHQQAFEKIFTDWFGSLYAYAWSVLGDSAMAEEAVQTVFCRIWEKKDQLKVHTSLKAYLYGSVYHECMDLIRRERRKKAYRLHALRNNDRTVQNTSAQSDLGDLEKRLRLALDELPDQCRAIFQLSRFGDLKYREIAGQLGLSVKTVEAQITKALKHLRKRLVDFL